MVTSASAHSLSHPHAENRSPNDDEGAEIGHFLRIRPCVLDVRYGLCCDKRFEICMLIFSFHVCAGRLSFVDLFFPYIDVASHVFVVSVMCIFKKVNPRKRPSTIF